MSIFINCLLAVLKETVDLLSSIGLSSFAIFAVRSQELFLNLTTSPQFDGFCVSDSGAWPSVIDWSTAATWLY